MQTDKRSQSSVILLNNSGKKAAKLLANASTILSSSLHYEKTLAKVAKLMVPNFADWCVVHIVGDDNKTHEIVVAHVDPKKIAFVKELQQRYPSQNSETSGVGKVIKTGKPDMLSEIPDEMLAASAKDAKHLELIRKLSLKSYICVPLKVRNRVLGAITLVAAESGYHYGKKDLAFLLDLAKRAAVAVDNARLYHLANRIALAVENSQLYEKAQQGIIIRDEFLNIASHELRTPLTSLQLQMQILKNKVKHATDEAIVSTLQVMLEKSEDQTKRLANLINMLLDVSKMNGKKLELEKESVDLSELTKEIIQRFDAELQKAQTPVLFKNGVHPIGKWDRFRIDQVITNILSNAIKYGEGKPITVSVNVENGYGVLQIQDQGYGIAPADSERIFARFERTDAAKKHGGLGLGLYIASEIVKLHGGNIQVSSAIGKGSQFSIKLPLSTD